MPLIGNSRKFDSSIALRVGSNQSINDDFNNSKITFGCPANWIQYAYSTDDDTIGDKLECIFAHIETTDSRINSIVDKNGNPMKDNLHIIDKGDGTCFLRLLPTILSPTICLYSVNVSHEISKLQKTVEFEISSLTMDLDAYLEEMKRDIDNSSYLIITNVQKFIDELLIQVPNAVKTAKNLTSNRHFNNFDPKKPFVVDLVEYEKIIDDKTIFYDYNNLLNEVFRKRTKYNGQSEMRIMLSHINFIQRYEYSQSYDYKQNQLEVFLPNLHDYAMKFTAKEAAQLQFINYNQTLKTFDFGVVGRDKKTV